MIPIFLLRKAERLMCFRHIRMKTYESFLTFQWKPDGINDYVLEWYDEQTTIHWKRDDMMEFFTPVNQSKQILKINTHGVYAGTVKRHYPIIGSKHTTSSQ